MKKIYILLFVGGLVFSNCLAMDPRCEPLHEERLHKLFLQKFSGCVGDSNDPELLEYILHEIYFYGIYDSPLLGNCDVGKLQRLQNQILVKI